MPPQLTNRQRHDVCQNSKDHPTLKQRDLSAWLRDLRNVETSQSTPSNTNAASEEGLNTKTSVMNSSQYPFIKEESVEPSLMPLTELNGIKKNNDIPINNRSKVVKSNGSRNKNASRQVTTGEAIAALQVVIKHTGESKNVYNQFPFFISLKNHLIDLEIQELESSLNKQ